jgi:hypothetical protein
MNYIMVGKDKIVRRQDDISESAAISCANNFLLCMPVDDWRKLVGEPKEGETFEKKEAAYIIKRGWKDENGNN